MSAFTRTQTDSTWTNGGADGYVPTTGDWESLVAKLFAAVNGDRGGVWRPNSQIAIAGGGLNVTGPTLVRFGSIKTTGTSRFRLGGGASDWPLWGTGHAKRSRQLLMPMFQSLRGNVDDWIAQLVSPFGLRSIALSIQSTDGLTLAQPSALRRALRVHDGATLSKVEFCFRVPQTRTSPPVATPKFRVYRVDIDGNAVCLKSTTPDANGIAADTSGYASPAKPSSGVTWMANGGSQLFEYVCDQNNVIDVSQYSYWAMIIEEAGANSPVPSTSLDGVTVREQKVDVRLATTGNIAALTGAATIDGATVADGDRVLVKNQTTSSANGIYVVSTGGAWTRATDFDALSDLTPFCFVRVTAGSTNVGTSWEFAGPKPTAIGSGAITFQRLTPQGNSYHTLKLYFDDIVDLRWQ